MSTTLVNTDNVNHVYTVTLNRPQALNALSQALQTELAETFDRLNNLDHCLVIILTGAGKAFSAGLDLKDLAADGFSKNKSQPDLYKSVAGCKKPIIVAVNGYAITGGFELALMGDILIAGKSASFADTHARVGVVPGWGLSQKLPRIIGISRAKELSLTGNFLSANQALVWGLVNHVIDDDTLLDHCQQLALDICSCDQATLLQIKDTIDAGWQDTLEQGLAIEKAANKQHLKNFDKEQLSANRQDIQNRGRNK